MFDFSFQNQVGFLLAAIPGFINMILLAYIVFFLPKNRLINIFALLTLAVALWQMNDAIARISVTAHTADRWETMLSFAWIFVGPLCLHFALLYCDYIKATYSRILLILLYAPAIAFISIYQSEIFPHIFDYSPIWGWINYHNNSIFDELLIYWISLLVLCASALLIVHTYQVWSDRLLRTQSLYIALGIGIPTLTGVITEVIFPTLLHQAALPVTSTMMTFFSLATVLALAKYRLFSVTELIRVEDLIGALPFILFSVSDKGRVTYLNEFGARILDIQDKAKRSFSFRKLLNFGSSQHKANFYDALNIAMAGKSCDNIESSIITKNTTIDILLFANPIINNNRVRGVLFAARDVSELMRNAKKLNEANNSLTEKNIELENRNAELASFNYIASHDLQEPLRKIQTFSYRIKEKENSSLSSDTASFLDRIIASSQFMQKLIEDLLNYSRLSITEFSYTQTDLNELVSEVVNDLKENIDTIKASVIVSPLPALKIIRLQFRQLLFNLVNNSIKYAKHNVQLRIEISAQLIPAIEINHKPLINNVSNYWKITISDNGIGFEEEYAERIFLLFQRLHSKEQYSGTGIGLSICKKVVENHRGFITAKGIRDEGATFEIFIPDIEE